MRRLRRSQTKAMSEEALKKQLDRAELLLSVSRAVSALATLALQLLCRKVSESMGNHDSKIVDWDSVD